MGLQWANEYLYHASKTDFTATEKLLAELYQPLIRQNLSYKDPFANHPYKKKEVKEHMSNINLVLTAEGLATFIKDLQEMATDKKREVDERGNYIYDGNGDYKYTEIPLAEREVAIGNVRITEEGKFALKVDSSTFAKMEALYAQKARIEKYQAS